jgi:hypothetical protein
MERKIPQIVLSNFSNIFRFNTPPTQGHQGGGDLASSLFGKTEYFHFGIWNREFRNHADEIHSVKAHSHDIKRFVRRE